MRPRLPPVPRRAASSHSPGRQFAHLAALHFAGGCPRKVGYHRDLDRALEAWEPALAARPEIIEQRAVFASARDRNDIGDRHGSEDFVGPSDHDRLEYPRVAEQDLLDLSGVHLLTATIDDVVGSAGEEDVAVGIHTPEVARVEPARLVETIRRAIEEVTAHNPGSANPEDADLAGRQRDAVRIPALDLAAERRANGPRMTRLPDRRCRDLARSLGHAPAQDQ